MSSTGGSVHLRAVLSSSCLRRPELSIRGKSQKPSMSSSLAVGAAFPTVSFSSDEEDGAGGGSSDEDSQKRNKKKQHRKARYCIASVPPDAPLVAPSVAFATTATPR